MRRRTAPNAKAAAIAVGYAACQAARGQRIDP
jgi:hypothetical protein